MAITPINVGRPVDRTTRTSIGMIPECTSSSMPLDRDRPSYFDPLKIVLQRRHPLWANNGGVSISMRGASIKIVRDSAKYHQGGRVKEAKLAAPHTIQGIALPAGAKVEFNPDGSLYFARAP